MLRRILLFIGITLVAMLLGITVATRTVLMNGFSNIERRLVIRNLARVENAVSDQIDSLVSTTNDWAWWDDTYRFVQDRNAHYIEANLDTDMFTNLKLGVLLLQNTRGEEVFGATFDPARGLRRGIPSGLRSWLARNPFMTVLPQKSSHAEGIIPLPEGALLAAARPVLDSKASGPVRGTLLMGRFLDAGEVRRLSRSLMMSVSLFTLADQQAPESQPLSPAGPLGGRLASIDTSRADVVAGSAVLQGAGGWPALLVKVQLRRDVYAQAVTTARYFTAWLIVIGVVFSAVVLLVVQRTALLRLGALSRSVLAIGTGGEPGGRVSVKGRDQIAYLGAAINGMLEALEGSHESLRRSEQRNKAFLDAIPDLIARVTRDGKIVDIRFPGHSGLAGRSDEFRGALLCEVTEKYSFVPQGLAGDAAAAVGRTLDTGLPVVLEFSVNTGRGAQHFLARFAASGDAEAIILVREITAEKRIQEVQRHEILVKEIHHRVKNNLQVISSLLGLQASTARDPRARAMLDESRDRVRSVALIHERLYQAAEGVGGGYPQYVRDLADQLLHSYRGDSAAVAIKVDVDDVPMEMDQSVPVGLIMNELLTNALAHAFPPGRSGRITVRLKRLAGGMIELAVADDGVGFPEDVDYRDPASLGLRIVNILVQQIKGTLALDTRGGTAFLVTFPAG